MAWLPQETAVVLLEQRGFEHIVDKYFQGRPKSKREALANEAFVTALFDKYVHHTQRDAETYLNYVGKPEPKSILDIGCGIGLLDALMYGMLKGKPMLYMLDGAPDPDRDAADDIKYASGSYVEKYDEFTFRIELTRECLVRNSVPQEKINFVAPTSEAIANLKSIDFVVSRASWGNHYPLSVYWDGVKACLNKDSTVVVDIRDNEKQFAFLQSQFHDVVHVERHDVWTHWRVGCKNPRWL